MQGTPRRQIEKRQENPLYRRLEAGFTYWLRVLNFEPSSQRDMPKMLHEFLSWMDHRGVSDIHRIGEPELEAYVQYLENRPHQRREGGIGEHHIRKHVQVIRKFSRYLSESGQESFTVHLPRRGKLSPCQRVLSEKEIQGLYTVTGEDAFGLRDRALLALYYGCGLRKREGMEINTGDILLDQELVYVRKGKGYRQRFVPLTGKHKADIAQYLEYGRPYLVNPKKGKEEALLLTRSGGRFLTPFDRIQRLKREAGIHRPLGLHTLRHSIATHLLHSGMELEQIRQFLGHRSLESTQIYTHLSHAF